MSAAAPVFHELRARLTGDALAVYDTLLRIGPTAQLQIDKAAGLTAERTDAAIDVLREIFHVEEGRGGKFRAVPPAEIVIKFPEPEPVEPTPAAKQTTAKTAKISEGQEGLSL